MSSPTAAQRIWSRPSPRLGARSTRRTGRPITSSAGTVSCSFTKRCRRKRKTSVPNWSPRSVRRCRRPTLLIWTGRLPTASGGRRTTSPNSLGSARCRRGVTGCTLSTQGRQRGTRCGGAITPWNFPFEIISNKVAQILATGNTMVLKPAIETPWSGLRWGRIVAEKTDIPAGVFNVVPTSDNGVAQLLATDPRVDMVSFTGSTAVGTLLQRLSADTMKRTLLELGGKSAYMVLDDADMDAALPGCIGALIHSGQGCGLTTRMLVPRQAYDQAVEVATAMFAAIPVGDPTDPTTFCGPLVSAKQRDRVLNYIEIGKQQGAA